jgi:hypothetical protein
MDTLGGRLLVGHLAIYQVASALERGLLEETAREYGYPEANPLNASDEEVPCEIVTTET